MIDKAYNSWADSYDSVENKTRDLDKIATEQTLSKFSYKTVLELGCGTGKNTKHFAKSAELVIGLDFSEKMLVKARQKIKSKNVQFLQTDLTKDWQVENDSIDLISCNLTLEHISDLNFIFNQAFQKLKQGGVFFISELHPFKQYTGSQARFESSEGLVKIDAFTHNISNFLEAASKNGFQLLELNEWFDDDKKGIPRLVSFLFETK